MQQTIHLRRDRAVPRTAAPLLVNLAAVLLPTLAPSQQVSLQNGLVRFDFDPATGMLVAARDLLQGSLLPIQNDQPWKVLLRDLAGGNSLQAAARGPFLANGQLMTPTMLTASATNVDFGWLLQLDPANAILVVQRHALGAGDTWCTSSLEVYGDGQPRFGFGANAGTTTLAIHETRTYLTSRFDPSATRTEDFGILSARGVHAVHGPSVHLQPPFTIVGPARTKVASMSWTEDGLREGYLYNLLLGAHWYDDGAGIYAMPERGSDRHPLSTAYRSLSDQRFQMVHIEKHARDDQSGQNVSSAEPLRVGLFRAAGGVDGWFDFARLYRDELQGAGHLPARVSQRGDLTPSLRGGELLLGFFGPDTDPTAIPYQDAAWRQTTVSIYDQTAQFTGAGEQSILFFIGWNRHAPAGPWAHSLYYPKPGQELLFQDLTATTRLRPLVYTLTNTVNQTPLDPQYAQYSPFITVDVNGNASLYDGGGVYGWLSDLDPSTGAWAALTQPRLEALRAYYGVGAAYFDSPAPVAADYGNRPGRDNGPGDYQIGAVVDSLAWIRGTLKANDPGYFTVTENLPEAFVSDVDLLGGDGQAPYLLPVVFDYLPGNNHLDKYLGGWADLQEVLFNPAVYHRSVPMVGLGALALGTLNTGPVIDPDTYWHTLHFHNARAVLEGGAVPGVYELGGAYGLPNHRLDEIPEETPWTAVLRVQGPRWAGIVKDLLEYRKASRYLVDGEGCLRPLCNVSTVPTTIWLSDYRCPPPQNCGVATVYNRPDLVRACWQSSDPASPDWFGLYFFCSDADNRQVNFRFDAQRYGYGPGRLVTLYQTTPDGQQTKIVTAPDTVLHSVTLTRDRIAHFEVHVQ